MAALTKNATVSAMVESTVLNRMAVRNDSSSRPKLRDCTSAECR
jgi:hypothetical protein